MSRSVVAERPHTPSNRLPSLLAEYAEIATEKANVLAEYCGS